MVTKIFAHGRLSEDGSEVLCPLPTSSLLFLLRYCQTQNFQVEFVNSSPDERIEHFCCAFNLTALDELDTTFTSWNELPVLVRNVALPSLHQPSLSLVRSGLCVVLRHIIKASHREVPELHNIDLLGFRQGSMKMCAEVSGWTKLCEVELPKSLSDLINIIRPHKAEQASIRRQPEAPLPLPLDLTKLEEHFKKKCLVHNDDRKKRTELARIKQSLALFIKHPRDQLENGNVLHIGLASATLQGQNSTVETEPLESGVIEKLHFSNNNLFIAQVLNLPHGIRKVTVNKAFTDNGTPRKLPEELKDRPEDATRLGQLTIQENSSQIENGTFILKDTSVDAEEHSYIHNAPEDNCALNITSEIIHCVGQLSSKDIEFVHTYSEGVEMTLADLILFVDVFFFLESLDFQCRSLVQHIPLILQWARHMTSLPKIVSAGEKVGLKMVKMKEGLRSVDLDSSALYTEVKTQTFYDSCETINFIQVEENQPDEDEMELSRCVRMKHRAIKPEVLQVLKKFEVGGTTPVVGLHPRGENVTVDWDSLPSGVHPREGNVPEKRTRRKCQQLENLVTAVQAIAKPKDVIVDFCSGGGHLGIVIAYLLPDCEVFLVENKEESLLRACSRLENLKLSNVTLFQGNMDYFVGKFDIGVCLHACGSATDMVLQLCLNSSAAFVICPCCYGSIHKTHLLNYPRSNRYTNIDITYKDFLTLGHAADQTEFNIVLEDQGRRCMNFVDMDRAEYAREFGYRVTVCTLKPLSCTPKNNLLVGTLNSDVS